VTETPGEEWRDAAACREPRLRWRWFAGDPYSRREVARICAACPVRQPCAALALSIVGRGDAIAGTWAGINLGNGSGTSLAARAGLTVIANGSDVASVSA
jgi:hypothetical protein